MPLEVRALCIFSISKSLRICNGKDALLQRRSNQSNLGLWLSKMGSEDTQKHR